MSRFVRGEIVVVPFPFSTGMDYKVRPALVISPLKFGSGHDYFLCCVSLTAEPSEQNLIEFDKAIDMEPDVAYRGKEGSGIGYIRPTTLFTIDGNQVNKSLGKLLDHKIEEVMAVIRAVVA